MDNMVRWWWETVGMPTVLQHREAARLVRRTLRPDVVVAGDSHCAAIEDIISSSSSPSLLPSKRKRAPHHRHSNDAPP